MGQDETAATNAPQESADEVPAAIAKLPPAMQAALTTRRYERTVMVELSKTNWGEKLDLATRRAVSDWGERHGIDVAQEIDILGNRIYLNARFYLRGLAWLIEQGRVEYVDLDHVEDDPRLVEFPAEKKRRLELRIQYHLPENAVSAVIARVKLKGVPVEFSGAQWCGGRGMKKVKGRNGAPDYEVQKDPIGDERPVETSETHALRRCLRLMVTHIPQQAKKVDAALKDAETSLEEIISQGHERNREEERIRNRLPRPVSHGGYDDALPSGAAQPQLSAGGVPIMEPAKRSAALVDQPSTPVAEPYQNDSDIAN